MAIFRQLCFMPDGYTDTPMDTSPEEALAILRKWEAENTPILCMSSLTGGRLSIRGSLALAKDRLAVIADGVIRLSMNIADAKFQYMQADELPSGVRDTLPSSSRGSWLAVTWSMSTPSPAGLLKVPETVFLHADED